jgi:hypothetical protein
MGEDSPGPSLRRRVPGASGSGPSKLPRNALPDGLMARMQAAVDAAHAAQGTTGRQSADPEPVAEPLQMRAANYGGGRLDTDALDDLAESYLAADPDLAAGYADDIWTDEAAPRPGWEGLRRRTEPGTGIRPERAAWWERAIGSGRPAGSAPVDEVAVADERPPEPRRTREPIRNTPKLFRAPARNHEAGLERSPKYASAVKPERAVRPDWPAVSDYGTGPVPVVSPERAVRPGRPAASDYGTGPIPVVSPERAIAPARTAPPGRTVQSAAPAQPEAGVAPKPERAAGSAPPGGPPQGGPPPGGPPQGGPPQGGPPPGDLRDRVAGLTPPEPPGTLKPTLWTDWGFARDEPASAKGRRGAAVVSSPGSGGADRPQGSPQARRRYDAAAVALTAIVVILIAASIAGLVLLFRHHHDVRRTSDRRTAANQAASDRAALQLADVRDQAAAWVVAQVSRHVRVSCDPVMCQVLAERGFPARSLYRVTSKSGRPLRSAVVVATPALWRQFGAGFGAHWAPTVLAGFGRGADRITVRVVAPHGAAAYKTALNADLKQRIAVGSGLAASSRIAGARVVRQALAEGLVDSRLLSVITALAGQYPINILEFGKNYSGTSVGTPFRMAVFAETDPAAGLSPSAYVDSMINLLRAQSAEYRPALITTVRLPSGQRGLQVQFAAPSPLGLLNPPQ